MIIINVGRLLPVLSTRQEQERGTFLRALAKLQRTKGVTRVGVAIRERLKKGSSAEEKPWGFERLGPCGNMLGEVSSTLLYTSQQTSWGN